MMKRENFPVDNIYVPVKRSATLEPAKVAELAGAMLKDGRTWTTLAYFILMLPLGIIYFVIAVVGLSVGLGFLVALPVAVLHHFDLIGASIEPAWIATAPALIFVGALGLLVLTTLMHGARGIGRTHAQLAKRFLVTQD